MSLHVPSFPKIFTLGASYTQNALHGNVSVQEKIDGSQFGWGINENGKLVFRTRSNNNLSDETAGGLFGGAVSHLTKIYNSWNNFKDIKAIDCYFWGEVVSKPKHNILKYSRVPNGTIVLFDGMYEGRWLGRWELKNAAEMLEVDLVPEFYWGGADLELVRGFMDRDSFLGDQKIEGLVIKNYGETVTLGGITMPLFTKVVRPEFKEQHKEEWGTGDSLERTVAKVFAPVTRWQKAVQHLRDSGTLQNAPQDIGPLFKEVNQDILAECQEDIKNWLWEHFRKGILKESTRGLAEWYKERLAAQWEGVEDV